MSVSDFIQVKRLANEKQPDVFEEYGDGYFLNKNGASTCLFHNGDDIHFIGYVEFIPNKCRGNHYHLYKSENICVVKGDLKARFAIPNTETSVYEIELHEGDLLFIKPGCAHSFISSTSAAIIEYSKDNFVKSDSYEYEIDWNEEIR